MDSAFVSVVLHNSNSVDRRSVTVIAGGCVINLQVTSLVSAIDDRLSI